MSERSGWRRQPRTQIQRFVVKIGASVLTDRAGHLLPDRVEQLAGQVVACARGHRQPIMVSSGAIACGMARLGLTERPTPLAQLQACAAIGQSELMHLYTLAFRRHRQTVAQVLLTQEDLSTPERFRNAKQTLLTLLHRRVVPIVNENDTVAVEEITFGDNDRLAALVASTVDAQLLIILSDVDGFLRNGRVLRRVGSLQPLGRSIVAGTTRQTTKGGMASKLKAASIAARHGIPTVVANGARPAVVQQILSGKPVGTLFLAPRRRPAPSKQLHR